MRPLRPVLVLAALLLGACGGSGSGSASGEPLSGPEVYARSCASCHGDDGTGVIAPTIVGVHDRLPEAEIMDIIANGIVGESGAMPGWSNLYSAEEITAVTEYLRTFD